MEIEKKLQPHDIIVSSTDLKGKIIYANSVFCDMCEYSIDGLMNKPHNIIRHPDMPKCVFKFAWDTIQAQKTIVAYVKNYTKCKKKYYWVKAIISPIIKNGVIDHYTSYRTRPTQYAIDQISQIYKILLDYERTHSMDEALNLLVDFLKQRNLTYDQFIYKLNTDKQVLNDKLLSIDINQLRIDHIVFKSKIMSQVQQNISNIKVQEACCCDFGKKLAMLEHEPFARDQRFIQVKLLHESLHTQLEQYISASSDMRLTILKHLQNDLDKLFDTLIDLIDNYKG